MTQLKLTLIAALLLVGVKANSQQNKGELSLEERAVKLGMQSYIALENGTPALEIHFDKKGNKTLQKKWKVKTGEQESHVVFTYDANNALVEEVSYDANDVVVETILYTTNKAGYKVVTKIPGSKAQADDLKIKTLTYMNDSLLIETLTTNLGKHSSSETYTYHPNGVMSSKTSYRGEKTIPTTELRYDDKGITLINIRYDSEGKIKTKVEFTYNDNGEMLSRKVYDRGKKLVKEESVDVDAKGNITARYEWQENNKKRKLEVYEYDTNGNLLHKYNTDPLVANPLEAGIKEESYLYDSKNRVTASVTNRKTSLTFIAYEYHSNGAVTESYGRTAERGLRPKEAISKPEIFHIYRSQTKDVETKKVLEEVIFQKKEISSTITYTYDKNWNMLSQISSSNNGRGREIIQEFDDQNRLIHSREFRIRDGVKSLSKETKFSFDKFSNMTLSNVCRRMDKGENAMCKEIRKEYSADGLLMDQKEIENDALMVHVQYTYNDQKQLTKFKTIYGEATYKYDKKGEMIEQRFESREGEETGTNTWAITYY